MGGNLELKALESVPGKYKIILKIYLDLAGTSDAESDHAVRIYRKSDNTHLTTIKVPLISRKSVIYENETCTEKQRLKALFALYETEITLDPNKYNDIQGYYLSWTNCCRNGAIVNLKDPLITNSQLTTYFPPLLKSGKLFLDSSPSFNELDGAYICVGEPFYYPFNATDSDGDELRYSLRSPGGYNTNTSGTAQWVSGYSAENAIPGNPALRIDAKSGELFVVPSQLGLFVFSVVVEELRNGEVIGSVQRDYQLYVVDCQPVAPPDPTILIDNQLVSETSVCEGKSITLTAIADMSWNYQWKKDGKIIENAKSATLQVWESGEYQLVTSLSGACSKTSRSNKVKIDVVKSNFALKTSSPPVICASGGKLSIYAIANDNYSYQWFLNTSPIPGTSDSLVVTVPGSYHVTVTDQVQGCKSLSDTMDIKSVPLLTVTLASVTGQLALCQGDSLLLQSTERSDFEYTWYFNDQKISVAGNAFYADEAGIYTVVVKDSTGCENQSSPLKVERAENVVISMSPIDPMCGTDHPPVTLSANPTGGVFSGNGVSGNTFDPKKAGTGIHEIQYSLEGSLSCTQVSDKQHIAVWKLPEADAGRDIYVREGESSYIGIVGNIDYTYSWSPPEGLDDAANPRPRVTPVEDTEYTVQVTDPNGCTSHAKVTVRIFNKLLIPDAFTPNADGKNDTWELSGITSYPEAEVTIYNRWGEVVFYSKGYEKAFDGRIKGVVPPSDVYVYKIKLDKVTPVQQGTLMLLR
ncbi:gliding motility-associated C-terminal domain-containing protein [Dyadobacter helix]|nr:gliding motility-associated C-terminal domain-containing protein [Dyadobacter sp. CECT 9275]